MKMPGQPSSDTSFQASSAYIFDSASSRSRSSLKRFASRSRAVSLIALWSSVKSKFIALPHPRQAENALGDDVLQDLRRAALDRVRACTQEAIGPVGVEDRALVAADVHRELGQRLVGLRPLQLRQRALRARLAALHDLGQAARCGVAQRLGVDVEIGDLLADDRVLVDAALAREIHQLAKRDLDADRSRAAQAGALEHQRRERDLPSVADAADHVLVG